MIRRLFKSYKRITLFILFKNRSFFFSNDVCDDRRELRRRLNDDFELKIDSKRSHNNHILDVFIT